jgi:hypothetical protein
MRWPVENWRWLQLEIRNEENSFHFSRHYMLKIGVCQMSIFSTMAKETPRIDGDGRSSANPAGHTGRDSPSQGINVSQC